MESSRSKEVSLVYRDNDLFQDLVPTVVQEMQALGLEVDSKVFPKGEDPAKIAEWIEENKARLKEMRLVVDGTVRAQALATFAQAANLDGMMHDATLRAVLPDYSWRVNYDYFDLSGTNNNKELLKKPGARQAVFLEIMRRIAESGKAPKRVFIHLDKLSDHAPFCDEKEVAEMSRRPGWWGSDEKRQYDKGKSLEAFETLKNWLIEAGIEEVEIYDGQDLNGSDDWVLIDRHAANAGFLEKKEDDFDISVLVDNPETPVMVLPAENFVASALKNGLLDGFNPEAVRLNIKGTVQRLFAKVSE